MQLIADPTGRFAKRPFFETSELDIECETLVGRFLRKRYGKVEYPITTEDLTRLMEEHVEDFDSYADLSQMYGAGVEGVTEFTPGRKPTVRISKDLAESEHRENRLRTTLTHEFGHVFFHSWLFDERDGGGLFPTRGKASAQVCKRETILDAPMVDWMEWQAGHVCGALLMPASRVRKQAKELLTHIRPPDLEPVIPTGEYGTALIQAVAGTYLVSKEAAKIRLLRLALLTTP
jgi:hypothetical protein